MKKHNKRNNIKLIEKLLVVIPIVIALCLISRTMPGSTVRLDIGESGIGEKAIALTFDDGPTGCTEELLDGLGEYDAKATFFVLGSQAEKYPETVLRAYEEGHLIGNHTYDHTNFLVSSKSTIEETITKGENTIESIIGKKPLFLRVPHGYITAFQLKQFDKFFVKWSLDSKDWNGKGEDYVYNHIMSASDGDIVLLHDTSPETVNAVLRAIPELQEQGYEFVTVDELISRNGDKIKMNVPYRKCEYEKGAVAF